MGLVGCDEPESGTYLVYALTCLSRMIDNETVQQVGNDSDDPVSIRRQVPGEVKLVQYVAYTYLQKRYAILTGVQWVLHTLR